MKIRKDLLDSQSPAGIEVIQLTQEAVPSSHIYMEAQIFTPDSKRLVLHRSAHPHGSDMHDPEHRYLLCDLADGCKLSPLTHETGATGPSVSPDGLYLYYFANETAFTGGRLTLKRVKLDGTGRETLLVVEGEIPGTHYTPTRIYPLSTISTDGRRISISCYLGDGVEENAPWGLLVFDLDARAVRLILSGQTWCNLHPQYSRNPERGHDILVQENHGNVCDTNGICRKGVSGRACDIHVIRDDGTDFRDLPWGRDNREYCQGHQCWRGRSDWAITSLGIREPVQAPLVEGMAAPHAFHRGIDTPGGRRNILSRNVLDPQFFHFATDIAGKRLVTDGGPAGPGKMKLLLAELGEPGRDEVRRWAYLLNSGSTGENGNAMGGKGNHIHPFLSPDGKTAFFNSDESGVLQAYMVRGLENI